LSKLLPLDALVPFVIPPPVFATLVVFFFNVRDHAAEDEAWAKEVTSPATISAAASGGGISVVLVTPAFPCRSCCPNAKLATKASWASAWIFMMGVVAMAADESDEGNDGRQSTIVLLLLLLLCFVFVIKAPLDAEHRVLKQPCHRARIFLLHACCAIFASCGHNAFLPASLLSISSLASKHEHA